MPFVFLWSLVALSVNVCGQSIIPNVVPSGVLSETSRSGDLQSVFAVPSVDDDDCTRDQNRIPLPDWGPCKSRFLVDQDLGLCTLLNFSAPGNYTLCSPVNTIDGFEMDVVEVLGAGQPSIMQTSFNVFFVDQPDTPKQIMLLHVGLTGWEVAWSPFGGACEDPSLDFHGVETVSSSLVFIGAVPVPRGIEPGSVWALCAREAPGSPAESVFQDPGTFYGFPPVRPKAILALGGITGVSVSGGNLTVASDGGTVVGDAGTMVMSQDASITFYGKGFCSERFAEVCGSLNMFLSFNGPTSLVFNRDIANFLHTGNRYPCSEGSCVVSFTYGSTPGRNPLYLFQAFDSLFGALGATPRLAKWGLVPQVFGDGRYAIEMRGCGDISGDLATMYPKPAAGDRFAWMPTSLDGPYLNSSQVESCVSGAMAPISHKVSLVAGSQVFLNDTGLSPGVSSFCYFYSGASSWGLGLLCLRVKN